VTVGSRLATLEASLSPTELVVRWLAEAHAHDDLGSYSASLLDADPATFPMDRLAREARESAIARSRGRPRSEADSAVRAAIIAALVRVQIVLRINVLADEFVTREVLVQGALSAHLALAIEPRSSPPARDATMKVAQCRDLLLGRAAELHALEAARDRLEARFLDGSRALFPAGQRAWDEQRRQSERMAVVALRLAELDGHPAPPTQEPAEFEARIERLVADHLEPARSTAYNELGDGRRAAAIAARWVRPKVSAPADR